jgi:hypothetical protein
MRRLRISKRLLGMVLLAIIAKGITSGPRLSEIVGGAALALLLLASAALARQGRRLEPPPRPTEQPEGRGHTSANSLASIRAERRGARRRA